VWTVEHVTGERSMLVFGLTLSCFCARSGMDADRWTSRVPDNDGWGNVRLTAAKPRRK
jgi:hypothetical protein